jgi:hypothetical protein
MMRHLVLWLGPLVVCSVLTCTKVCGFFTYGFETAAAESGCSALSVVMPHMRAWCSARRMYSHGVWHNKWLPGPSIIYTVP